MLSEGGIDPPELGHYHLFAAMESTACQWAERTRRRLIYFKVRILNISNGLGVNEGNRHSSVR